MRLVGLVFVAALLAPTVSALVPAIDQGPFGAWRIEDVTPASSSAFMATIALDAEGHPFIANTLQANGGQTVRVLSKTRTSWDIVNVASGSTPETPITFKIGMDSAGRPSVLYQKLWTNEIRYASQAGGWVTESVLTSPWATMAVTPDGTPHVFYNDGTTAMMATRTGPGTWVSETIAPHRVSYEGDAHVASDATIRVLAQGDAGLDLTLYVETKAPGGTWQEMTVPTCNGTTQDMTVDQANGIHIVCQDGANQLTYAHWDGASWTTETLPGSPLDSLTARIAVSPTGVVGIATTFNDFRGVHVGYTSKTPAGWVRETVDNTDSARNLWGVDIAMDQAGHPKLTYAVFYSTIGAVEGKLPRVLGQLKYAEPVVALPNTLAATRLT